MVEFKKNVKKNLPYDRERNMKLLNNDSNSSDEWYGVTFQLPGASEGKNIGLKVFIENYEPLFKKTILKFDSDSLWIVNHDDKDWKWFPNDEDNSTSLRALFKHNNIPNSFKGALTFTTDDLLKYSRELISYPYTVFNKEGLLYSNLDISHSEIPFLLKTDAHWGIDFLSTNKELLREVMNEISSSSFIIRQYRGVSLWDNDK